MRVWMLQVVLPQQILAVVVAVRRAHDGVDVLAAFGSVRVLARCRKPDRPLVIELDQDHRAVDAVVEHAARVGLADPREATCDRGDARTSSIFTRACPSSMLST